MTAQVGEILIYQGKNYSMCSEPLEDYFEAGGARPDFVENCTALWRGYVGTWKIDDDRLFLIKLEAMLKNGEEVGLKTLFPDFEGGVLASWYSGSLRIPDGQLLKYVHAGYGSIYERDIQITIKQGSVTKAKVKENGKARGRKGLVGYGVAAMSFLTSKVEKLEE